MPYLLLFYRLWLFQTVYSIRSKRLKFEISKTYTIKFQIHRDEKMVLWQRLNSSTQRINVFATNSVFVKSISLQPHDVNL